MRMRKKKHGEQRLAACGHIVCHKPETPFTCSSEAFGRDGELHLEIGCGKGDFACLTASKYPEINFFALEKISDVVVAAAEKAVACENTRPDNLRFAVGDASKIEEWFAENSVDTLYLNFSDPWPKSKHYKRRLTYRKFLESYFRIIKDGGKLKFKTDNRPLFDFTLEELDFLGIRRDIVIYDLHNSEYNSENIQTEYERNFSAKGFPINMLVITVHKSDDKSAD